MSNDESKRIQILAAEGATNELVDVAIIAVGFGIEAKRKFGIETTAYWEDDGLDQALGARPDRPHRILVSGAGDGALIDLMRATLRDFRHEEILDLLPKGEALQLLQERLLTIETTAKRARIISRSSFMSLHQMYDQLELNDAFIDQIRQRIRHDTEVWFNFTSPGRYIITSSILNRFLVAVLCRLNAIKPKLGRMEEKLVTVDATGRYAVRWSNNDEPQVFDRIIVHHGPPEDYLGSIFPNLADASTPLGGKLRELNLTDTLDRATSDFFSKA